MTTHKINEWLEFHSRIKYDSLDRSIKDVLELNNRENFNRWRIAYERQLLFYKLKEVLSKLPPEQAKEMLG